MTDQGKHLNKIKGIELVNYNNEIKRETGYKNMKYFSSLQLSPNGSDRLDRLLSSISSEQSPSSFSSAKLYLFEATWAKAGKTKIWDFCGFSKSIFSLNKAF